MSSQPLLTPRSTATPGRSMTKTVTWRIVGSLDTFVLGWLITGNAVFAGSIASTEVVTKMILYYVHERIWGHVRWGQKPLPAPTPAAS